MSESSLRRPNIFIASASTEKAMNVANAVKQCFYREADVDIWNENIFKPNRSYLETLLNRASYYDFAIAIFTADDRATIGQQEVKVTRGNVIFEFGLFLGRLGPNRAFLLHEEGVDLFSDWTGIALASFTPRRENMVSAVGAACHTFREEMRLAINLEKFTMLPSTSLAIGYYQNFLKRVFDAFDSCDEYTVVKKDDKGNIEQTKYGIVARRPVLHVMVPRKLQYLDPTPLKELTASYKHISVTMNVRDEFRFYIKGSIDDNNTVVLCDIPTTMYASRIAITRSFTEDFLARDNTEQYLEGREIANFERTLSRMVTENNREKSFKFSILE